MDMRKRFIVEPGTRVRLSGIDPGDTPGFADKCEAEETLARNIQRLAKLQYRLHAEGRRAVLVILQAMDAGGKDGTIRHVMSGLNPQGCRVTSFKAPSAEELAHDFLWRIHAAVPAKGEIGIFNRSHYEDVLVVRVKSLVPRAVWSRRYDEINAFERILAAGDVTVLKFFLHISSDEQKRRLEERLDDKTKNWKISPSDVTERARWGEYMRAYEAALSKCSTDAAPWFVIPSNRKWFRNLAVSQIIVETLKSMAPKFPKPSFDVSKLKIV